MIEAVTTEHLTGITLKGSFDDFYEIVESIHRLTGPDDNYDDFYWGVKNRLLGVCYDIRHAYMGDRKIELSDNGVNDEIMRFHSMILPKNEVKYCANILFPEAVFVALSVPEMMLFSSSHYGRRTKKQEENAKYPSNKFYEYARDKAVIEMLSSVILGTLAEVISDEEFEKIMHSFERRYSNHFFHYVTHYIDKCNLDYIKTPLEKRPAKIKNITKRIINKPDAYNNLKSDLEHAAKLNGCSIYELILPDLEYPEEIEW